MRKSRSLTHHARLIEARIERGFENAKAAAEAFGWSVTTYQQYENGTRALSRKAAAVIGSAFGVDPGMLLYGLQPRRGKVPLVHFGGAIDAGHRVIPSDDLDRVIEGIIGDADGEAFEIVGESMLPLAGPGDIAFFGPSRPVSRLIGSECIVELVDGVRLFKTIERGSRPSVYNLTSYNALPIKDVEIAAAGPFLGIKRKR